MDLQTRVLDSHHLHAGAVFFCTHSGNMHTTRNLLDGFLQCVGSKRSFQAYLLFGPMQESTDYLDRGTTTNFSRKGPSTIAKIKEALNFMRNQLFEVKAQFHS